MLKIYRKNYKIKLKNSNSCRLKELKHQTSLVMRT